MFACPREVGAAHSGEARWPPREEEGRHRSSHRPAQGGRRGRVIRRRHPREEEGVPPLSAWPQGGGRPCDPSWAAALGAARYFCGDIREEEDVAALPRTDWEEEVRERPYYLP